MKLKDIIARIFLGESIDSNSLVLSNRTSMKLYHFTNTDLGEVAILDPKETVSNRMFFSKNDYKVSDFPRTFFYVDYTNAEREVSQRKNLYEAEVTPSAILNITNAIREYKSNGNKIENDTSAMVVVSNSINQYGVVNIDSLIKNSAKHYDGICYETGGRVIVNMFIPVRAIKIDR